MDQHQESEPVCDIEYDDLSEASSIDKKVSDLNEYKKQLEGIQGTTLSGLLPLTQEPQTQRASFNEGNGCRCIPRIMVVDDNNFNIVPVKMMLESQFQRQIEQAENG